MLKKLLKEIISSYPLQFIGLILIVSTQAIFNTLSVIAVAPITDFLTESSSSELNPVTKYLFKIFPSLGLDFNLLTAFIFFGLFNILNGISKIILEYNLQRIKYDVLIHLLSDVLNKIFRARFLFFSQGEMGTILNSLNAEVHRIGENFVNIARFIANLVQASIFIFVPFFIDPRLSSIFVIVTAVLSLPLWFLNKISNSLGLKNLEKSNKSAGVLLELLNSSKIIVANARRKSSIELYRKVLIDHAKVGKKFKTLLVGAPELYGPIGIISALIAVYVGYLDGVSLTKISIILFSFTRLIQLLVLNG